MLLAFFANGVASQKPRLNVKYFAVVITLLLKDLTFIYFNSFQNAGFEWINAHDIQSNGIQNFGSIQPLQIAFKAIASGGKSLTNSDYSTVTDLAKFLG